MSDTQLEEWCKDNLDSENPIDCSTCPNSSRCDSYTDRHKHSPFDTTGRP